MDNELASKISWFEIAALLGALAWLPHIVKLFKDYFSKAEITIIMPKYPELGFSTYGNIFNTKIAFATKNKDIVVSEIGIKLKHESGFEKYLSWQGIVQRLAEFIKDNDTTLPMEKSQSVLAIKLNQKDIEERFIRFQDNSFLQKKDEYEIKLLKKLFNLKKGEKLSEFPTTDEFLNLIEFINHSFMWQSGKYEIEFIVKSPDKFVLKDYKYNYELTPMNVDKLEKNKECIKSFVELIGKATEDPKYKAETIKWNWHNPLIQKST